MPPESWSNQHALLVRDLMYPPSTTPLLREILRWVHPRFTRIFHGQVPRTESEADGIAYGSKCGVQEHSAVPPVCLPAFIHLIVTLSSSSVKGGAQAGRMNRKPGAATTSINHVNTKRLDVRPPIRRRHSQRPLFHPPLSPIKRNPADLLASHPR